MGIVRVWAQTPAELLRIHDYRVGDTQTEPTGASMVRHIWQDKRGFMWFATTKGLIRFDGVHYQHYYHQPGQPHSLGGNSVKEIREMPSGELYLALNDAGLSCFNPKAPVSEAFTNYRHDPKNPRSIPTDILYALEIDQQGIVWMGGKHSGLIRFDPRGQTFTTYNWPIVNPGDPERSVYEILADPDGSIWVGTSSDGLMRFWPKTGRFEVHSLQSLLPKNALIRNSTGSFYLDAKTQTFWFGSIPLGLCQLNKRTGQVRVVPYVPPGQAPIVLNDYLTGIEQDRNGILWLANVGRGLFRYDPIRQQTTYLPLVPESGQRQWLETMFLDRSGVVWAGWSKGVLRYQPPDGPNVQAYRIQDKTGRVVMGARRVEQDATGDCWLEFDNALARYDTTRKAVVDRYPFPRALQEHGLQNVQVLGTQLFLHGNQGIYYLNRQRGAIEELPVKGEPAMVERMHQIQYNRVVLPDTIGREPILWIGTFQHGLLRYWVQSARIESIPLGKSGATQNIESLCLDRQHTLWIATNGQGLFRMEQGKTNRVTQFLSNPADPTSLPDNEVTDVLEDHTGTVWISTLTHGLTRLNQLNGRVLFTTFSEFPDGPPSRIFSFFEDPTHLFWILTGDGQFLFNPKTSRFLQHTTTDQMLFRPDRNNLSHAPDGSPLQVVNGAILKGSGAGAAFVRPKQALLHFTNFSILNQPHPELLTNTALGIRLTRVQNQFSIGFVAPWFQHPEQIRYRYQLTGFDMGWTEADTRREAFYTNIPHGNYTFRVQASWDGTNQFTRTIELPITVIPAYWETGWFKGLIVLLISMIGGAIWTYRKRQIQLKANLRVAEAEQSQYETEIREQDAVFQRRLADTEMTALRAQMNPHFIFNCLNSIKLYTLQNDTDKASDYLTKFAQLIRLVLENSRAERVTLQNELEALQLYSDLEAMRFKQKVTISIRVDPDIDQEYVQIPPLLLQPYVENAIWHGLMHKPEGGSVLIDVTQPTDQFLHIEITDDGIGRARANTLKSKSAGNQKSFGMQVTADRIRMINQLYNTQTKTQILDLTAPDGEPLGTKVVLEIPV